MTKKSIRKTPVQSTGAGRPVHGSDGRRSEGSQAEPPAPPADGSFARQLLEWYDRHARSLPWRVSPAELRQGVRPDPYRVWLSEIMLQQTTVAAVKGYFAAFTERWPMVADLARAQDAEVMGAWAGLGYYARARNLLACARQIAFERGGRFPGDAASLRALPGVGDYTSAAIAAIAFDEPVAVVDGNIERISTRIAALATPLPSARKAIRAIVHSLTPALRPGDFAQAMMDLGATICTPRRPACVLCPVADHCEARRLNRQEEFPVKLAKKAKPSRVGAAFVLFRAEDGAVWLRKRPSSGMLGGMSEPPSTNWSSRNDGATGVDAAPFPAGWALAGYVQHGFTHFDLTLEVWSAEATGDPPADGWWAKPADLAAEALPTLMRKVIERAAA